MASIQNGHNELGDIHQVPFCCAGVNVNLGIIFMLKIRYFSIRLRGQTVDFLPSFHALGRSGWDRPVSCAFHRPAIGNTHVYGDIPMKPSAHAGEKRRQILFDSMLNRFQGCLKR